MAFVVIKTFAAMILMTAASAAAFAPSTDANLILKQKTNHLTTVNMIFGKNASGSGNNNNSSAPVQTFNGKPIKAKPGEKVSVVASKSKIPITYSCRKGDCGTCEIMMNGLIVKACQAKIPTGKCDLKTF